MRGVNPCGRAPPACHGRKIKKNIKKNLSLLHMSEKSSNFAPSNQKTTVIMAKQSGIHQIKGKVGEMSYYRQSGVNDGLIRRINQGLSSRVKTSDEYANTRRNNAEFGIAGKVAGLYTRGIVPKWRPMFRLFYQSSLLKNILELVKADTTSGTGWGTRGITSARIEDVILAANTYAKNPFDNYFTNITITETSTTVPAREAFSLAYETPDNLEEFLESIGAADVLLYVNINNCVIGNFNTNTGKYGICENQQLGVGTLTEEESSSSSDADFTFRPSYVSGDQFTLSNLIVTLVAVPRRLVNGNKYELQEYASYKIINYKAVTA